MRNHFVNGRWLEGSGSGFATCDPASGEQTWSGIAAGEAEVGAACDAARAACPAWAQAGFELRAAICGRFAELVKQHAEEFAQTIAREVGKPLWEARTEVASIAAKIPISVQAYQARTGFADSAAEEGRSVLRHRPLGVFGVFGPYNFPGHLPNGHIVPALIAGNTVVFKASEYAPQTAIRAVELWNEAGLPPGVLNLVNGGRETGQALARHPALDGILFTGSYRTGAALHRQFAGQPGKMLALEMGGNNPFLVWHAANRDAAVHHAIFSAFVSAGQRCTCARRLIVEDSAQGQAFIQRLCELTAHISVGRFDGVPQPFMGPVISSGAAQALLAAQQDLLERGGKALLPMRQLQPGTGFVSPGLIDVTEAREVPDEEWFGPLLQVLRVPDFGAALRAANATEYGLAAGLLSDDETLWERFLAGVRAGIVNWNRPTTGAASSAPFGGIGKSGNYRPSAYYAADYCAYPVASMECGALEMPRQLSPGLVF